MSYLHALRLTFAGRFQAAVSTVNNDPTHFDNLSFKPEYQQRQRTGEPNGWWNPRGDANWRMIGCAITSASLSNGDAAPASDPVLRCIVADAGDTVAAKLVDLDPEQQMVSEIWGMEIRIADARGHSLMRGRFEPAAFTNIWNRWPAGSGDGMAGAIYQSVLTSVEWGDVSGSPFLTELRAAATDRLLSIKFNVDAFDADFRSPTFTLGRVAGTIGPASAGEPHHLVVGRQFLTTNTPNAPGFFAPAGGINFCAAVVDEQRRKVYLDLGNSLPTGTCGGPFVNLGSLSVWCAAPKGPLQLGSVDYLVEGWYERTAGIVALPSDRPLHAHELKIIASNPLVIGLTQNSGQATPAISESPNGVYIRADQFVFRLNPGEEARVRLVASTYGRPYADARALLYLDPSQLQGGPPAPDAGTPPGVLDFPARVTTGADGQAVVTVKASDPGNPRRYIDGQVYGIRPVLEETLSPAPPYPFNPADYVSFLVWDEFRADPPTWYGCLQPVFQQYANLYPIMDRFVDLSSYDSICQHLVSLRIAFGLPASDPNAMPVTRDLSESKRQAILRWLENLQDGKPLLGAQPAASAALVAATMPISPGPAAKGGKHAAASRRLAVRRPPDQL